MIATAEDIEFSELASLIERYLGGALAFAPFRKAVTHYGVYPGRNDKYLIRIRVPCAILLPVQLEVLGLIAERWGHGSCHLTTRQSLEIHGLSAEDLVPALKTLAAVDLTSHESGGGTVRNIVLCPHAGTRGDEPFDVTPWADALGRHLLRNPAYQDLPRKIKIGISCCRSDCARTLVQDIGFQARYDKTKNSCGFKVVVGGGLGAFPRSGDTLFEFVRLDEALTVVDAILRVFDRLGDRKNRRRGRLKYLVQDLGIKAFQREVLHEIAALKHASPRYPELRAPLALRISGAAPIPSGAPTELEDLSWRTIDSVAVIEQEHRSIEAPSAAGNLSSVQLVGVAWMAWSMGFSIRVTPEQSLLFAGVSRRRVKEVHERLEDLGLVSPVPGLSLVSCPGKRACPNAFANTEALSRALASRLAEKADLAKLLSKLVIRVSGCVNGCSRHAIADIGLEGTARRIDGTAVPAYRIWVGGFADQHRIQFGEKIGIVPARRVPGLIIDLLLFYRGGRAPNESFGDFARRMGTAPFCQIASQCLKQSAAAADSNEDFQ